MSDGTEIAAQQIRGRHPYAFRSGEWADLLSITKHAKGRDCYAVRFSDGTSDFWPVDDAMAGYELPSSGAWYVVPQPVCEEHWQALRNVFPVEVPSD